jgi:hypothetical protein
VPYREIKNGAMDVPKAGGFFYSSFAAFPPRSRTPRGRRDCNVVTRLFPSEKKFLGRLPREMDTSMR